MLRLTSAPDQHHPAMLAAAAGIPQPYLAQLESGRRRSADIAVYARLARQLAVQLEDLIPPGE